MIVEVIAVGTELLLGQIVNTNAAEIGRRLAERGLDHYRQTVVGDNLERCAEAIAGAIERADAVIITGGLGPTQDDLTRHAICAATGREMAFSDDYARELAEWWARRGREMPESNLRQAEHPAGAELIPNRKGTAPGLRLEHSGTVVYALPGVPAELYLMLDDVVMPELAAGGVVHSRLLRTWGESESRVAELLGDLFQGLTNPTLAFLASSGEIKLRLTTAAPSAEEARAVIAPVEEEIRARLGPLIFGVDDETIERRLLALLGERGWTIGTAESATGGRVAAALTSVPGSSASYRGSVVAYASDLKERLLAVEGIDDHGAVSEATAMAMAEGAARLLAADVVVAVTGSAGPDPQEQPAGTMVVAVRTPEATRARLMKMPGDRERVLTYTTTAALHLARLAVEGAWSEDRWIPTTQ